MADAEHAAAAARIRQEIWDAYGLDDMTEAERAAWDAYGRARAELDAQHAATWAAIQQRGKQTARALSRQWGVRLEWRTE